MFLSWIYVLVHVVTVLIFKWYVSDMVKAHKNLEFRRKYAPFIRKDLHYLEFTRSLWWLLIWPRTIFYFSFLGGWFVFFTIWTAGKNTTDLSTWKRNVLYWLMNT